MKNIPFQTINWKEFIKTTVAGDTGSAVSQTIEYPGLRIRLVEYSAGYKADHWCQLGHIIHCLNGEFISELSTGEHFTLSAGMSYVVSDKMSSHRSVSENGAQLLIIDGEFLASDESVDN